MMLPLPGDPRSPPGVPVQIQEEKLASSPHEVGGQPEDESLTLAGDVDGS